MRSNRELAFAVKRALATGTIALCGAGAMAAYAQQATTAQPATTQASATKTTAAKTAKTTSAKAPILLAQATQTTASPPSATLAPATLETVVVTGTLIARPQAETAEAITIVKADNLKNQGIVNVEQALNTLTNNVPTVNISSTVGSFSGGGTYANLRGLGDGRTLVLLDGQRLANNANDGNAVDLSGIPFSAIDNVQVLREGASAEYGSDAIAGVINFITKKNYQGAEVEVNFDQPQESGGSAGYGNFTLGHGDLVSDGYNVMLTGSYTEQQQLRAAQRSFTSAGYYPALGVAQTNDPGTWPATIVDANNNYYQPGYPACAGNNYLTTSLGNCAYRYSAATDLLPKSSEGSGLLSITKALQHGPAVHQCRDGQLCGGLQPHLLESHRAGLLPQRDVQVLLSPSGKFDLKAPPRAGFFLGECFCRGILGRKNNVGGGMSREASTAPVVRSLLPAMRVRRSRL